jgi:hypothetical protein
MVAASTTRLVGNTPNILEVKTSARVSLTEPPGVGRNSSASPKKIALVAMVVTIGCSLPKIIIRPFKVPQASPAANTATMPKPVCSGVPTTSQDARQLHSTRTIPAERSMPAVITTRHCAIATNASSVALLDAVCTTFGVKPAGWLET